VSDEPPYSPPTMPPDPSQPSGAPLWYGTCKTCGDCQSQGGLCYELCKQFDCKKCSGTSAQAMLLLTYWFVAGSHARGSSTSVRFSGRRIDGTGVRGPGDSFTRDESIDGLVEGCGPVSITTQVRHLVAGEWVVTVGPPDTLPESVWSGRVPGPMSVVLQARS